VCCGCSSAGAAASPFSSADHRTALRYTPAHRLALIPGVDNAYVIVAVPCAGVSLRSDAKGFFALQIACDLFSGTEGQLTRFFNFFFIQNLSRTDPWLP
jgi:hypothetical protein